MNSPKRKSACNSATIEAIPRKVLVCALHRCQKCLPTCQVVPESCQWKILHPLETRGEGVEQRERQTGKTTELVAIANLVAEAGYLVYYLSETESIGNRTKSRFMVCPGVRFMSWKQSLTHLRGMAPGVIVADDIRPKDMEEVRRNVLTNGMGYLFLAHYWTPRA